MKNQLFAFEQSKIKSTGTAYAMWFALGFHHAYLGNWGRQLMLITLPVIGLILFTIGSLNPELEYIFALGIGLIILGGLWYFFDLFMIPRYVRAVNEKIWSKMDYFNAKDEITD